MPASYGSLRNSAVREVGALVDLICELEADLPAFGPRKFADALKTIVEDTTKTLESIDTASAADKERLEAAYRNVLAFVRDLHRKYLRFLGATPSGSCSSEMLLAMIALARSFGIEDFVLGIWPSVDWQYGIESYYDLVPKARKVLADECRKLGTAIAFENAAFPKWFVEVVIPLAEGRNALFYSLLAHEFGHLKYKDNQTGYDKKGTPYLSLANRVVGTLDSAGLADVFDKMEQDVDYRKQVLDELQKVPGVPGDPNIDVAGANPTQARMIASWRRMLRSWLDEFAADFNAARIMGPAYVFALDEFASMSSAYIRFTPTHPSFHMRLFYLVFQLEAMGYLACGATNVTQQLLSLKAKVCASSTAPSNPFYRITFDLMERVLKTDVIPTLEADTSMPMFDAEQYGLQVGGAVADLRMGYPPSESWRWLDATGHPLPEPLDEPRDVVAVLNAGWDVYLNHLDPFSQLVERTPSGKPSALAIANLNDLVLKAVESAEILRKWRGVPDD